MFGVWCFVFRVSCSVFKNNVYIIKTMSSCGDELITKHLVCKDKIDTGDVKATKVEAATVKSSAHVNVACVSIGSGSTTPASGTEGDIWIIASADDAEDDGLYYYNGSEWLQAANMSSK